MFRSLVVLFLIGAPIFGESFYPWNEKTLQIKYSSVKKTGFPSDLSDVGSVRPHHESFLWKVLGDKKLIDAWPMALVLIGKVGGKDSFERISTFAEKNLHIEPFTLSRALAWSLIELSTRDPRASRFLFLGVHPEFWVFLREKFSADGSSVAEESAQNFVTILAWSKKPGSMELLLALGADENYLFRAHALSMYDSVK